MVVLFLTFKLYPYFYAAWLSVTTREQGEAVFNGLDNYRRLLSDPLFYKALTNTAVILVIQIPIMLTIAVLAATAFRSAMLKWPKFFRLSFFIPVVMGLVAYGILFRGLFNTEFGVVNYLIKEIGFDAVPWLSSSVGAKAAIIIALTWHYTGYNAIIYLAQMQSIPDELYEAAATDGASPFQKFWHVTLPGIRPAILLTVILSTIGGLQLFDEPYVLTDGGPNNATLTIGLYLYENAFGYLDFGYASAMGYVLALLIAFISFIQIKVLGGKQ
jgi:lactose/L-arabinose transport system permease protein